MLDGEASPMGTVRRDRMMGTNALPSGKERYVMHLLFTPVLASGIWIGGGSVGLLIVIVVVVLLLRR
jgi:hypothetical protein